MKIYFGLLGFVFLSYLVYQTILVAMTTMLARKIRAPGGTLHQILFVIMAVFLAGILGSTAYGVTTISPTIREVGEEAVLYKITVRSSTAWSASTDAAWVSLSPVNGTMDTLTLNWNGVVTVTVDANTASTDRVASITIGGQTQILTQRAAGTNLPELWAVGDNTSGQFGYTYTYSSASGYETRPVQVASGVASVAVGPKLILFTKTDGTLWGVNTYNQLDSSPVQIDTNVQAVAAGPSHSIYVKTDGTLWAMGDNTSGQLGDGTYNSSPLPKYITSGVKAVAASIYTPYSIFLKTDGTLWGMGSNAYSQFGSLAGTVPVPVQIKTGVNAISAGQFSILWLDTAGALTGQGLNRSLQLVFGPNGSSGTFPMDTGVKAIIAGADNSMWIKTDGTLWSQGQGLSVVTGGVYSAKQIVSQVDSVSLGGSHLLYIKPDGSLWGVGNNRSGQLGDGTYIDRNVAFNIATNVQTVVGGASNTFFIGKKVGLVPVVIGQPLAQNATNGYSASFSCQGSGLGIAYQWQVSTDGAQTWSNISNGPLYSGVASRTLTVTSVTSALNGYSYRCVLTGSAGVATTSAAMLSVFPVVFPNPTGIVASTGNLYVSDATTNTIQNILLNSANNVKVATVVAGASGQAGSNDGTGSAARFNQPNGIAGGGSSEYYVNLYVADSANAIIRKIDNGDIVTAVAGSLTNRGNHDGIGTAAWFSQPIAVCWDSTNKIVYVADSSDHTIRKIAADGSVTTIAGTSGVAGYADGTAVVARFNSPAGIALSGSTMLYVADTKNHVIRYVNLAASPYTVGTLAGLAGVSGFTDGSVSQALFNNPTGITTNSGIVYVADTGNSTIRKIAQTFRSDPSGYGEYYLNVSTLAGLPGISGLKDGTGSDALFNQPKALAFISTGTGVSGTIFVADTSNAAIREVSENNGTVTTIAITASSSSGSSSGSSSSSSGSSSSSSSSGGSSSGGKGGMPSLWLYGALSLLLTLRGILKRCNSHS